MTDRNLHKIFTKFGIVKFGAPDEAFDPNFHDALYEVPDSTKPTGTIAQVVKVGYKLQDRVIRAAQVGTTVNTPWTNIKMFLADLYHIDKYLLNRRLLNRDA